VPRPLTTTLELASPACTVAIPPNDITMLMATIDPQLRHISLFLVYRRYWGPCHRGHASKTYGSETHARGRPPIIPTNAYDFATIDDRDCRVTRSNSRKGSHVATRGASFCLARLRLPKDKSPLPARREISPTMALNSEQID
jgi:hypothetical protein